MFQIAALPGRTIQRDFGSRRFLLPAVCTRSHSAVQTAVKLRTVDSSNVDGLLAWRLLLINSVEM
jgi:hypothetical protein